MFKSGWILFEFQVNEFMPHLSDHCSVSILLKIAKNIPTPQVNKYEYLPKPEKIVWNKVTEQKFENIIQSTHSKLFLSNFASKGVSPTQDCVDSATNFLSEFLVNSAQLANSSDHKIQFQPNIRRGQPNWKFRKKTNRRIKKPKWHDETCETMLKKIKQSSYLLKKFPNNSFLRCCLINETKSIKGC